VEDDGVGLDKSLVLIGDGLTHDGKLEHIQALFTGDTRPESLLDLNVIRDVELLSGIGRRELQRIRIESELPLINGIGRHLRKGFVVDVNNRDATSNRRPLQLDRIGGSRGYSDLLIPRNPGALLDLGLRRNERRPERRIEGVQIDGHAAGGLPREGVVESVVAVSHRHRGSVKVEGFNRHDNPHRLEHLAVAMADEAQVSGALELEVMHWLPSPFSHHDVVEREPHTGAVKPGRSWQLAQEAVVMENLSPDLLPV